jgi:hypothetical protein
LAGPSHTRPSSSHTLEQGTKLNSKTRPNPEFQSTITFLSIPCSPLRFPSDSPPPVLLSGARPSCVFVSHHVLLVFLIALSAVAPAFPSRTQFRLQQHQTPPMDAAAIYADFSLDGPEIGTLVIVVDRAKNLPNRKTTKQDPYCQARLGKTCCKTKTDRRGGQTPRW